MDSRNRITLSVPQWKACDDYSLYVSDRAGNGHPNTTGSRNSPGMDVFWESLQTSIGNIPFDGVAFEELHKSLATIGINKQVTW